MEADMAGNTLFRTGEESSLYRGHGTDALGPSDSSDSGSDMQGVSDTADVAELGLDPTVVDDTVLRGGSVRARRTAEIDPSLEDTVINYPTK